MKDQQEGRSSLEDPHLRETGLDSEEVFNGRLLKVKRDRVRLPDGKEAMREYITHPGAVVIIAQLNNGKLLFERQYRYPLDRVFIEFPAGKIDGGEAGQDTLLTAQRELKEETGYIASEWHHLGVIHPGIGYSNERIEIYFARDLNHVGNQLDEGEFLDVIELSLEEALESVRIGALTDGKSVATMLWAERVLSGAWSL